MLSLEIILLILIIITAKYRRQQQCIPHLLLTHTGCMWGEPLKGPQNTQILTVMRDSGSFRGQQQQMIFTKAKRRGGRAVGVCRVGEGEC